ncbi:hypothetical protein ACCS85_27625 [Rhizobium ruizarguesonis]
MIVTSIVKPITLAEAAPGELVRTRLGPSIALAIVLKAEGTENAVLGALEEVQGFTQPFTHIKRERSAKCVSFGTAWVLEPKFDSNSWYGNRNFVGRPGALHLSPDGWHLCFGPPPQSMFSEFDYNLTTNEIATSENVVPACGWSIWESEAARLIPNSQPLFSYGG